MADKKSPEIDEGLDYVGYREALNLVYSNICPVGAEEMPIEQAVGRITSEDVGAVVDNPSSDVSFKDGFAVKSEDVARASAQRTVRLQVIGSGFAGSPFKGNVVAGSAVKICSGSPIPPGADAVVSAEFCEEVAAEVYVSANAEKGRNILHAGEDIKSGTIIATKDTVLFPGTLGLMAAAGITRAPVYRRPKAAVIAVGDEVVAPGKQLRTGQLYASNLVTISAWLVSFGIPHTTAVIGDNQEAIQRELRNLLPGVDTILTSGGAWGSERDLVVGTLDRLGWQKIFHHVRMGPGKGIAFGLWAGKPVFCLPGGPASNEMAFLQFALPGLMRLGGQLTHPLRTASAKLTETLTSRHRAWTEFKDATLSRDSAGNYLVTPYQHKSRLQSIATATCLICIPEGTESLQAGELVTVQLLAPPDHVSPGTGHQHESQQVSRDCPANSEQ